jgi:hypothetical protein
VREMSNQAARKKEKQFCQFAYQGSSQWIICAGQREDYHLISILMFLPARYQHWMFLSCPILPINHLQGRSPGLDRTGQVVAMWVRSGEARDLKL